jgi:hypothetical protein
LSDEFPIRDDVTKGDTLSLFLLHLSLEYAIWKMPDNQEGLDLPFEAEARLNNI